VQKRLEITNKYDKKLSTIIELPENNIKDFLIISHCFTCSKLYKLYNNISKLLVAYGYGVVRYDAMGLGDSEGDFSKTSFTTNVEDVISVYNYIKEKYKEPRFLMGHSLGSIVSIKAGNLLGAIEGVITVGSPSNFDALINIFSAFESRLDKKEPVKINLAGSNLSIGLDYLKDLRSESVDDILKEFNKDILIFHSNADKTVTYKEGLRLFNTINANKSFITLKGVDHLVGDKEDADYIGEIVYKWLEKFPLTHPHLKI